MNLSVSLYNNITLLIPLCLQSKLPYEKINNLTTDWNDGTLIAKLVDAMAPGLCPEAHIMEPENALENASTAMDLAEQWLNIPQVCHVFIT